MEWRVNPWETNVRLLQRITDCSAELRDTQSNPALKPQRPPPTTIGIGHRSPCPIPIVVSYQPSARQGTGGSGSSRVGGGPSGACPGDGGVGLGEFGELGGWWNGG